MNATGMAVQSASVVGDAASSMAFACVDRAVVAYRVLSARADRAWAAANRHPRAALVGFAFTAATAVAAVAIARSHKTPDESTAALPAHPAPAATDSFPDPLPPPRERHVRNDVPRFLEKRRRFLERKAAQQQANQADCASNRCHIDGCRTDNARAACDSTSVSDGVCDRVITNATEAAVEPVHMNTTIHDTQEPSSSEKYTDTYLALRTRQNQDIAEALRALPDTAVADKAALAATMKAAMDADIDGNSSAVLVQLESILGTLVPGLPP